MIPNNRFNRLRNIYALPKVVMACWVSLQLTTKTRAKGPAMVADFSKVTPTIGNCWIEENLCQILI